jgi:hypothetical protein
MSILALIKAASFFGGQRRRLSKPKPPKKDRAYSRTKRDEKTKLVLQKNQNDFQFFVIATFSKLTIFAHLKIRI